jgi:hypothetical protein
MLKIGIEKIQEMNNHFHRNESYTLRASANLTTLPISEQNSILIDESVTHPKEKPALPTSCQIFQDWFLSTANVALTPALSTHSVGFNIRWSTKYHILRL